MQQVFFSFFVLSFCASFAQSNIDYGNPVNWAALPFRKDEADEVPKGIKWVNDSLKQVDVFFVYPTTYSDGIAWNADITNEALNKKTDNSAIKNQASVFNGVGRVYSPRYRQAIYKSFFNPGKGDTALAFAYNDVKAAFQYYMEHYNNGRPFILASHSQGTYHATRLMKELIDGKPIQKQMVVAYLIGFPVREEMFKHVTPCNAPDELGCYEGWYTYKEGFEPKDFGIFYKDAVCVNPITWKRDTIASAYDAHQGMILLQFDKRMQKKVSVRVHNNILWASIKNPLAKNYNSLHIVDFNLFWYDIRKHLEDQVAWYFKRTSKL